LDRIPGIGKKTAERLLKQIGSLKKIGELTIDELMEHGRLRETQAKSLKENLKSNLSDASA
jgi:excinuclease ABC subunit C